MAQARPSPLPAPVTMAILLFRDIFLPPLSARLGGSFDWHNNWRLRRLDCLRLIALSYQGNCQDIGYGCSLVY